MMYAPASPEEITMADKRIKDYGKEPSGFISPEDKNSITGVL
jgi:hypothetical protein